MASESVQDKLGRNRPPRVHISYKVYTGGATKEKELPFVVGVISDLLGKDQDAAETLAERDFKAVDRDNFDQFLQDLSPHLNLGKRVSGSSEDVELTFDSMASFEPEAIVKQIYGLWIKLQRYQALVDLQSALDGNPRFVVIEQFIKDFRAGKLKLDEDFITPLNQARVAKAENTNLSVLDPEDRSPLAEDKKLSFKQDTSSPTELKFWIKNIQPEPLPDGAADDPLKNGGGSIILRLALKVDDAKLNGAKLRLTPPHVRLGYGEQALVTLHVDQPPSKSIDEDGALALTLTDDVLSEDSPEGSTREVPIEITYPSTN